LTPTAAGDGRSVLDLDLPSDLVWADDSTAGIRRRRAGAGFSYLRPGGKRIADDATLGRIRALAVPPAWTDVWICTDPCGHIQATGRDARGRKQYRYHARFRAHRDEAKFARLHDFGTVLPTIRRQVADDLAIPGIPREKIVATVIRLLEATLVRVGNEEYAKANKSYGLTTLRNRHAHFDTGELRLVFKGKHGIESAVRIQDQRLRRVVKRCQDLPGQLLFQYLDDDGDPVPITSGDVNEYLRAVTSMDVTAKDFRTWMGTLLAAAALGDMPEPRSERDARRTVARVLEVVSGHLGNTPAVCRASYVHPLIIESYHDGSLATKWHATSARGSAQLVPEERKLLRLLAPRRSRQSATRAVSRPQRRAA
jgi:DNA topoisomerase-1